MLLRHAACLHGIKGTVHRMMQPYHSSTTLCLHAIANIAMYMLTAKQPKLRTVTQLH